VTRRGFFPGVRLTRITGEGAFLKTNSLLGSRYVGRAELYRYVQLHLQASRAGNANGRESPKHNDMRGRPGATPVPTPLHSAPGRLASSVRYSSVERSRGARARRGGRSTVPTRSRNANRKITVPRRSGATRRTKPTYSRSRFSSLTQSPHPGGVAHWSRVTTPGKIDEHHKKALGEEELTQA